MLTNCVEQLFISSTKTVKSCRYSCNSNMRTQVILLKEIIVLFTSPSFTFLSIFEKEKMVRKICKEFTHKRIFRRRKICQLTIPYFVLSKYYAIDIGHNGVWCSKKNTICLGNCICDMDASLREVHKELLAFQKHRFSNGMYMCLKFLVC